MKQTILIMILFIGCNYFQAKEYTQKTDERGRYFELCLKSAGDAKQAGGNVKNCDAMMDDLTASGKLKNFRQCVDYYESNKSKLTRYLKFNCYDIVFGE